MRRFEAGDPVIYRKTKHGVCPGPRAVNVTPQPHGEGYTYLVDKFWRIREVREDGKVLVYTRGGKQHEFSVTDKNLHKPGLLKYFIWRHKFPAAK